MSIVLGAWVRLGDAGLGCPDWPGCYGHLTVGQAVENADAANAAFPERPLEPEKALKEMIHRYVASGLGLLIIAIAVVAWRNRRDAGAADAPAGHSSWRWWSSRACSACGR